MSILNWTKSLVASRERAAAGALIVAATVMCFQPLLLAPRSLLVGPQHDGNNDLTAQFIAFRDFPRQSLARHGQFAFWNPYEFAGSPSFGNPQMAMLYPPNWIFLAVEATAAASWLLVLHHVFAGVGTYLLCRRFGVSEIAAATGAVATLAAPFWLAQTGEGHFAQICTVAWIPWILLAFERLRDGKAGGVAATSATISLSFLAGHAQEIFYLVVALTVVVLATAVWNRLIGRGHETAGLFSRWVIAGWAMCGMVSIVLLPGMAFSLRSVRTGGIPLQEIVGLPWSHLQQLFDPWSSGGPGSSTEPPFFWESLCYFGVATLVLALIAAFVDWRRPFVRRYSLLALFASLFAFGPTTFVFTTFHKFVPGVSLFREPSRAFFLVTVFLAVLAAIGIDRLTDWLDRRST